MKTKQPRKQRKRTFGLALHERRKLLAARLSKDLSKKTGRRSFPLRKGDKVKVMKGKNFGKEGKVSKVLLRRMLVGIEGITRKKPDGKEKPLMFRPHDLQITEMIMTDEKRQQAFNRGRPESKPAEGSVKK